LEDKQDQKAEAEAKENFYAGRSIGNSVINWISTDYCCCSSNINERTNASKVAMSKQDIQKIITEMEASAQTDLKNTRQEITDKLAMLEDTEIYTNHLELKKTGTC